MVLEKAKLQRLEDKIDTNAEFDGAIGKVKICDDVLDIIKSIEPSFSETVNAFPPG